MSTRYSQSGPGSSRGSDHGHGRGGRGSSRGSDGHGRGRGGFGGRGRGSGRPQSPVRLDVRPMAKEVALKAKFNREVRGKAGRAVQLVANHYPIKFSDIQCYHYDIEISVVRNDGKGTILIVGPQERKMRKERQMENIKVIKKMALDWTQVFSADRKPIAFVFDGNKNLYSAKRLAIGTEQHSRSVRETLDGCPEQEFQVKIKFVKMVQMNAINAYLNGTLSQPNLTDFRESLQVLDIVLRYCPQEIRIAVGRNLYTKKSEDQTEDQRNRIEIRNQNSFIVFGHHQSINLTQVGLTLNIDRATTPFRSDGSLIDYISRQLRVNVANHTFNDSVVTRLNSALRGLKIFTTHIVINGMSQKRKHTIEKMVSTKPCDHTIQTESGDQTIEVYFNTKYGKRLQYRNVPLIQIKGGSEGNRKYLPAEVCQVYPDQPMPRKMINPEIQRSIVESTNSQIPVKRFEKIHESMKAISSESGELMKQFGLELSASPLKLTGRELPAPKVQGDMNNLLMPIELKNYLFYNLSELARSTNLKTNFDNFFNDKESGMIVSASKMGLKIRRVDTSGPQPPKEVATASREELQTIEGSIKAFERAIKKAKELFGDIQMIFVCIPKESEIYETIKLLSDIEYGIPTQCIKEDNFIKRNSGYFRNFLRKTNAKLQGQNQVLAKGQRPAVFDSPTMVVGADVTHPGFHNPLANERVISSIAAVVGSYDFGFTKYVASVSAQPMNTEIIADFDILFRNLLKEFFKRNKRYPQNIVMFRDGVSDSQFDAVKEHEIPLIFTAYEAERIEFKPKITVYVVQKRHHTRIIPLTAEGNMNPGTVVDHTLTNPMNKEFHLCSHKGMLGTSRHAKYVVLRNDHKLDPDDLQKMAYHMCYAYVRCPTPISIPIPVKYADLAAFRTKQHVAARNFQYQLAHTEETDEQRREREGNNIRLMNGHIKVHDNIVFLPYYC